MPIPQSPQQQEDYLLRNSVMARPRSTYQGLVDMLFGRTYPEQATSAFTGINPLIMKGQVFGVGGNPMRLYHGTNKVFDFEKWKPSTGGAAGPGVYLAKLPDLANVFASREGGNVIPVYAKGKYLKIPFSELINAREWNARARSLGYEGLDTGIGEVVVFDSSNLLPFTTELE